MSACKTSVGYISISPLGLYQFYDTFLNSYKNLLQNDYSNEVYYIATLIMHDHDNDQEC